LLVPEQARHADFVLGSHDHGDHLDRAVWPRLAAASPRARFVVPECLREQLARELGIPIGRFIGLDDGRSWEGGGLRITGIAAAHEFLDRDPATGQHPYLGYVLEGNGCTLYHSGDTCIYEGLLTKLGRWSFDAAQDASFDVVVLPINGRDARRLASGIIGNMTYQEAADLAGSLRPRLTIPAHYDMFTFNREDPDLFMAYMRVKYPGLETRLCEHGEQVIQAAASRTLAPSGTARKRVASPTTRPRMLTGL
jgi:L-ascorbate metabolism protein UlaG (beta-lactamase superfamily)